MQSETAPLFASVGFAALFCYFAGKTSAVGGGGKPSVHKKKLPQLVENEAAFLILQNVVY